MALKKGNDLSKDFPIKNSYIQITYQEGYRDSYFHPL